MLFHVTWENISNSEADQRRSLAVFAKWQPPAGAEFKAFYGYADGSGGMALIEVADAQALAKTTAPWAPWLRFSSKPVIPIQEGAAIGYEAMTFRDSVK